MEPTPDTNESKKIPLFSFTDWKPYQDDNFVAQLQNLGIKYTPPKEREDLRKIIKERSISKNSREGFFIEVLLKWLEKGIMIDKFKKDENARHDFLLKYKIKTANNNEEKSLYEISKKLNKLTGNSITSVLSALQLISNFTQRSLELKNEIERIKHDRGYFIPDDLIQIDQIAEEAICQLLGIKIEDLQTTNQS